MGGMERIRKALEPYKEENWGKGFLYDYQKKAIEDLDAKGNSGLILQGGVGCGKSRTGLYWYFKACGGVISEDTYRKMWKPKNLYIITTAHKRDTGDWDKEMRPFALVNTEKKRKKDEGELKTIYPGLRVGVDSWQNIGKYANITDSYFIFDEDHVVSFGTWTQSFLKIAKEPSNRWIVMTATPADKWNEYAPVFVACGFYRNKTDFERNHVIWDRWSNFPKVKGYVNTGKLIRLRNKITVSIDYTHKIDIFDYPVICSYDNTKYNYLMTERFDPWKEEPIQNAGGLCYCLRRVCNENASRIEKLREILAKHKRIIVFYNYDYELKMLKDTDWGDDVEVDELNGHKHGEVPFGDRWIYLCQYASGAEAWNCISTNVIVFFSQTYSYKMLIQAKGRVDRQNTPFTKLYYYHFLSKSPIDISIKRALSKKKKFNEGKYLRDMGIEFVN